MTYADTDNVQTLTKGLDLETFRKSFIKRGEQ
jgi:hypothetical protein